jgi:hypothetical protein
MITIPPKLKILAGFKAEDDVTIDQIIAALEKKREGADQAKFRALLNQRQQEFPNESYADCFTEVANSDVGQRLFAQMKRSNANNGNLANQSGFSDDSTSQGSSTDRYDPALEADAKQQFIDLTERLALERGNTFRAKHEAWMHASNTHPQGKKWFKIWKDQQLLNKKELLAREQKNRSPHLYR